MAIVGTFGPVSLFTIRDLFAGVLAVVGLVSISVLAGLDRPIPDVLIVFVTAVTAYFFRGAENGGTRRLNGGKPR